MEHEPYPGDVYMDSDGELCLILRVNETPDKLCMAYLSRTHSASNRMSLWDGSDGRCFSTSEKITYVKFLFNITDVLSGIKFEGVE